MVYCLFFLLCGWVLFFKFYFSLLSEGAESELHNHNCSCPRSCPGIREQRRLPIGNCFPVPCPGGQPRGGGRGAAGRCITAASAAVCRGAEHTQTHRHGQTHRHTYTDASRFSVPARAPALSAVLNTHPDTQTGTDTGTRPLPVPLGPGAVRGADSPPHPGTVRTMLCPGRHSPLRPNSAERSQTFLPAPSWEWRWFPFSSDLPFPAGLPPPARPRGTAQLPLLAPAGYEAGGEITPFSLPFSVPAAAQWLETKKLNGSHFKYLSFFSISLSSTPSPPPAEPVPTVVAHLYLGWRSAARRGRWVGAAAGWEARTGGC